MVWNPELDDLNELNFDSSFFVVGFLGFVSACLVQPLMMIENMDDSVSEAIFMNDEQSMTFKRKMYSSTKVQAHLRKMIPIYDEMGIFD